MPDGLPFDPRLASLLERHDPSAFGKFMRLLELERLDSERELYEGSLLAFFERAWREIDPAKLDINFHHELICDKLEAITYGEIRHLVINQPPRTTKTILTNVIYPAWTWARGERLPLSGPQVKFLCVSYGARLAEEIAVKQLRLVSGQWYQSLWGDRVKIMPDQTSRASFGNTAGGERISNSIEGGILGRGGDIIICDDPHSLAGAESDIERQSTIRAFSEGLLTRITDPRIAARILVMQRLHSDDCTSWALENWPKDTVHIMLPMRFDPGRACPGDPRVVPGELLWPAVWDEESVTREERELGPYGVSGQLQQTPTPRGGGIFKREWLVPWPPLETDGTFAHGLVVNGRIQYPALEYVVAAVDTAFTEKEENDPSALVVFGVFRAEGKGRIEKRPDGTYERVADDWGYPKVLLLYGWEKRLELHGPPEEIPFGVSAKEWNGPLYRDQRRANWGLCEWVVDTCRRYKVDHLIIETQAAGHPLEQELHRLHSDNTWSVELQPARGSKVARAYAVQHLWAAGQIYIPTYEDGSLPNWASPIVDQWCVFPRGRHDDATDAMTGALHHLRSIGLFERKSEFEQLEENLQSYRSHKSDELPYPL